MIADTRLFGVQMDTAASAAIVMTPVDSGHLSFLAGIVIIVCLWLLGCTPRGLLLKTDHALRREYPKRREQQLGGKQQSTTRPPLEVLYPDPSTKVNGEIEVDIIAVHGLGSNVDWSWTWKSKDRDIHWLRDTDMLPNVVPKSRIMVYNYDSKWHSNAPKTRLQLCGEDLIRSTHNFRKNDGTTGRPILFIGHSLGGNVIQHALLYAESEAEFSYLPKLIIGLVFLGSPFRGSAMQPVASFLARVLFLAQSHAGIIDDLEYDSPTMTDKLHSFCRLRERVLIPTSCFRELYATDYGRKFYMPGFIKGMVVHEASACIPGCNRFNLQTDHLKLNKFSGPQDRSFISVSQEISKMVVSSKDLMERRKNLARESHFCVPFGRNRDFVGRESILARLLTTIPPNEEVDDCQRTAIVGLGGVGKTQIALEAAFRVRDQYPGCSIFWVPAVDATSFENAYREIGRQLGIKGIDEDKADVKTLVREALGRESSGHWLLIVDNADDPDLLFGDTALSDCLPFSLKGSILFTTRRHEVAVSLDIPGRNIVTTEEINELEATDLLLQGLNSHRPNPEDAKSLVVFLEKLPLAIKQASAYIGKTRMPVAKYLDHCKSSDKTLIKLLSKDFEDRARYKGIGNPVATSWLISFEHITRDNPVAARYLKFICFLAEKDIPVSLLPPATDQLEADEAIGILKAYAFITNRESSDSFDMHRLVRLATRNWLDEKGNHEECVTEVIQRLEQAFPHPRIANKDTWIKYLPHLEAALGSLEGSANKAASVLLPKAGHCYYVLGRYQNSEQKWRQALELQEKLFGKEHPHTLASMHCIAIILSGQGKYKTAEAMYRQTVALMQKVLGRDSPDTLDCMRNFGGLLGNLGKYEEAEQMLRQSLDQRVNVLDKDDLKLFDSMHRLATFLSERGKQEEAEGLCRQALEQVRTRLGKEHARVLSCMATLGQVLRAQEKYEEAEGVIRQTMDLWEKVYGEDHPDTLRSMSELAYVLTCNGNVMEAEGLCRRALELMRNVLGEEHPDTLSTLNDLAWVLSAQGEYEEAEGILRRTAELREKVLGKEHPDILDSLTDLATVLKSQGKREEAVALMEKCHQLAVQKLAPDHYITRLSFRKLNDWKHEGQE